MGGPESELYCEFKYLLLDGLKAARKHMDRIINIVEIMRSSKYQQADISFFYHSLSLSLPTLTFFLVSFSKVPSCPASRMAAPARFAICAIAST